MGKRLLLAMCVFWGCGGQVLGIEPDGGTLPAGDGGACCLPSQEPDCCMSLGGWSADGTCSLVCDGLPGPSTPTWGLTTDSHGCSVWSVPKTATTWCGVTPPPPDAAPPPTTCPTPADVSSFLPPPFVPPHVDLTACTAQQAANYYSSCFDPGTSSPSACMNANTNAPACAACLMSQSTASSWGALVATSNTLVTLDVAGCLAITQNDSSGGSCAARSEAASACEQAACGAQCPITDGPSFQKYLTCVQSADMGGCASYVHAECALPDAGPSASCEVTDFQTGFYAFAKLFCGG